jgi:hypothetical protein
MTEPENVQRSTLNAQRSTLNAQYSADRNPLLLTKSRARVVRRIYLNPIHGGTASNVQNQ